MAAVMVGQFHARDAEGRIYPVHEFQESTLQLDGSTLGAPITTYRLAIGDKVNYLGENRFELARSGVEIIRIPRCSPRCNGRSRSAGHAHRRQNRGSPG